MAFNVFDDSGQGFYFVILIITGLIGLVALILRFVASVYGHRQLGLEDFLAAAAVAIFLTRTSVGLHALVIINGRFLSLGYDPPAYESAFKMIFVADMITMLDQTFSKWSICALYMRIFGVKRNYKLWIWSLAAAQGLVYVGLAIMQPLQCRPINRFWQFWVDGECFPFSWILLVLEIPNSLIDFALVGLAMIMIKGVQLQTKSKWKLRFLFGLGSLAGMFGFIKIGLSYSPDDAYTTAVIGLWAAIQSTACIICCCAPVYRPLFSEIGIWSRLTSKASSLTSFKWPTRPGAAGSTDRRRTQRSASFERVQGADSLMNTPGQTWLRPHMRSTDWLVTGQTAEKSQVQTFPLRSIQVDRSVDVASLYRPWATDNSTVNGPQWSQPLHGEMFRGMNN